MLLAHLGIISESLWCFLRKWPWRSHAKTAVKRPPPLSLSPSASSPFCCLPPLFLFVSVLRVPSPIHPSRYHFITVIDSVTFFFYFSSSSNSSLIAHHYVTWGVLVQLKPTVQQNWWLVSCVAASYPRLLKTSQSASVVRSSRCMGLNAAAFKKQTNMGWKEWHLACITHPFSLDYFIPLVLLFTSIDPTQGLQGFNDKAGHGCRNLLHDTVRACVCVREREIVSLCNYLLIIPHSKHEICNHTTIGYY